MTRNDTRIIHTDGLEEGIRCAMCTNPMANNRGCDGGCDINESMYKRVLDVIKKNILEQESCEDAVSRQAVLDCFKKWQPYMATRLHEFENELFELPSVNPQESKWIPVSERLPEKGGDYLVTNVFDIGDKEPVREVNKDYYCYHSKKWLYENENIIAWMPLPESYKESEE